MRYHKYVGDKGDYIEHKFHRPRWCRCPTCGKKGRRVRVVSRRIAHVGVTGSPILVHLE
jgi:hypothetical protein